MTQTTPEVKAEILSKLTSLIVQNAQGLQKSKTPDVNISLVFAQNLIATYGIGPVFEAFAALNAGIETLSTKSDTAPPALPDGASKLVH
jgi:hypothetical protein